MDSSITSKPAPMPTLVASKKQYGKRVRHLAKKQYGSDWRQKAFGGNPQKIYGAQRKAYGPPGSAMTSPTSVQTGVNQANRRFRRFGNKLLASQGKAKLAQRKPTQYTGGLR